MGKKIQVEIMERDRVKDEEFRVIVKRDKVVQCVGLKLTTGERRANTSTASDELFLSYTSTHY